MCEMSARMSDMSMSISAGNILLIVVVLDWLCVSILCVTRQGRWFDHEPSWIGHS